MHRLVNAMQLAIVVVLATFLVTLSSKNLDSYLRGSNE